MNLLEWIKKLKKTDLFKSVSIVTLGGIAINFAQLVFVMILSRIISPKEFGIVSSLMIFVNFMNVINQLGIGSALIQKSHITETNIKFSYTFSMILSVFLGIIYILAMPFYLSYIDLQYILPFPFILFFYFPLKGLSSVAEALLAEKMGADYLGVGAIFSTDTKKDAENVSLATLREITKAVKIPVVAIGGISKDNISQLKGTKIAGICVISDLFSQKNKIKRAQELKAEIEKIL